MNRPEDVEAALRRTASRGVISSLNTGTAWGDAIILADYITTLEGKVEAGETKIHHLRADLDRASRALKPFADFVTPDLEYMPDGQAVTVGSPMARKQITAGDCRIARAARQGVEG